MDVEIVEFPETRVAVIEHRGPRWLEMQTARRLIEWRKRNGLTPALHRSFGLHYTDARTTAPADHRVDFCVSVDAPIGANDAGVVDKVIPALRCARARDVGSRHDNQAAPYLFDVWLPRSGESLAGFPIIFHYVNVGPDVSPGEAITDVYLPLRAAPR